jgi:hypothetical protein
MSVELIITRPASAISLSEWTQLVEEDDDLRLRREPFVAINPTTGATIAIKAAQADAEIRVNGQWMGVPSDGGQRNRLMTSTRTD